MLCKLAWGNVRRAGRDYLVYLLTLTLGVTVFYAFNTISMQVDIAGIDEKGLAQVMGSMLGNLTYFLAGVMAFLMVYANNWLFGGFCGRDSGIGPAQRAKTTIWN